MSEITNHIEGITGVSTANTDFIESAQRFAASKIPKELMLWAITETVPGTHGGNNSNQQITLPIKTDSLIFVRRDQFEAEQVSPKMRGFIGNSNSLNLATNTFPKYYIADGNRVIIKPDPDNTYTGHAQYVDYSKINEDSDLRNAVIYHAAASEFTKLASGKVVDWTDLVVPVVPTLSSNSVSFSQSAPTYISPVISLTTFPTITWTFPSVPVVPSTSAQTVATFGNVPTFTPPVMGALDFADTEDLITTEEDSEMLAARVSEIQAKIGEFSAKLGETQAKFNKENSIFQADVQEKIQEAQLSDAEETRKLQKYQSELQSYQGEVNKVVSGNQAEISEWQTRSATDIQKYGTDIQNALNKFNEENAEYQAQLQISIQDAQLSSQDDAQLLQDYSAKVNTYASEVNEMASKSGSATQNATYYSGEAKKYYEWANMEISSYIQNNSKMINRTIAAQAAQQRR